MRAGGPLPLQGYRNHSLLSHLHSCGSNPGLRPRRVLCGSCLKCSPASCTSSREESTDGSNWFQTDACGIPGHRFSNASPSEPRDKTDGRVPPPTHTHALIQEDWGGTRPQGRWMLPVPPLCGGRGGPLQKAERRASSQGLFRDQRVFHGAEETDGHWAPQAAGHLAGAPHLLSHLSQGLPASSLVTGPLADLRAV